MTRVVLSDYRWERIQRALRRSGAYMTATTRRTVEGIFWRVRTGAPWRDLPDAFGPWQTVYNRFNRWAEAGICEELFDLLKSRDIDAEWQAMDATIVRAHQHASGSRLGRDEAIGRSKGGPTTKVHALCDAHGNPTKIILSPGQAADVTYAPVLLQALEDHAEAVLADKAYDAKGVRDKALERGSKPVIPFRSTTKVGREFGFDRDLYGHRHCVENLFCRLKHFRAVATRYDKLARNFLALIQLACAYLWAELA